jgi:hypothetical protein
MRRIIGPVFYAETIFSEIHVRQILQPFFRQQIDKELYGHFQQDYITEHSVKHSHANFEQIKMTVFWVVTLCSLVEVYRRFRGACCRHQGDGGSKHL